MKLVVVALAFLAYLRSPEAALAPPEHAVVDTQGMAELVSAFLLHIEGTLFVYGRSRALDALLEQMPPDVPRSIMPPATDFYGAIRRVLELQRGDSVILVADDTHGLALANSLIADVNLPLLSRLLVWTWAESLPAALPPNITSTPRLFEIETTLAVSTADGSTFLFGVTLEQGVPLPPTVTVTEVDVWSPASRCWRRRVLPFRRTCSKWRRDHRGSQRTPLSLYATKLESHMTTQFQAAYLDFVTRMARSMRQLVRVRWVKGFADWWSEMVNCSVGMVFSFQSFTTRPFCAAEFADYYITRIRVVVPIGLGPRAALLQAVTDEFSAGLWWATVGAVLAVLVATALATMATTGLPLLVAAAIAPLQALAPLLGQPPPGRPAYRPLSTVWLLMSVVLAAAYQGLLLRELTALPTDIDSLEQLEQSGLEVRVSAGLYAEATELLSPELQSRVSYVTEPDLAPALCSVADMRNSALIIRNDMASMLALGPLLRADAKGQQRLHIFQVGPPLPLAHVAFTDGSPLRRPMDLNLYRHRDHGHVLHLIHSMILPIAAGSQSEDDQHSGDADQPAKPLCLFHLSPAFLLLVTFHVAAGLVLLLEIIFHQYSS